MSRIHASAILMLALAGAVQAEMTFRSGPEYAPHEPVAHKGHGHGRTPVIHLRDGHGAVLRLWTPELEPRPVEAGQPDRIAVRPTGINNYHAIVATREDERVTEVALHYLYFNGRPADKTPSALVGEEKAVLEIVPDPLPREHQRYLSGNPFRFLLRYQGEPLTDHPVSLYTSNGSLVQGRTGPDGRWRVILPDDFTGVRPGRRNNRPGDFVLRTALEREGRVYRTTLNASYSVNPSHWQSGALGGAVLVGGFLTGLVVLRRAGRGGVA